jgi:hypothetical protein
MSSAKAKNSTNKLRNENYPQKVKLLSLFLAKN